MSVKAEEAAPEWRAWVAENLLRGARPEQLVEALVQKELGEDEARSLVAEIGAMPELVGAARALVTGRRLELVARLGRRMLADAAHPADVLRLGEVDAARFFDELYAHGVPAVLTELARRWPAMEKWSFDFFRERFGEVEVAVTTRRDEDPDYDMHEREHRESMTMGELCDRIGREPESNAFYMVAQNRNLEREALAPLFDDVDFTLGLLDPERTKGAAALWLGPAGTVTPLHHDTCNILFVQVRGRKRFRMVSPLEVSLFERARAMYALDARGHHDVDAELEGVLVKEVVLEPGDALFIPVGWWHHVVALDASISLAFSNFRRKNNHDWYRPGSVR
jgi:hypothetical protein